jgi:hypothetical protein
MYTRNQIQETKRNKSSQMPEIKKEQKVAEQTTKQAWSKQFQQGSASETP